ncbi:MAG: beta strand repeat-containing protein [Bacteroidota bacterium]
MRSYPYPTIIKYCFFILLCMALQADAQVVRTESFEATQFLPTGWGAAPVGSATTNWSRVTNGANTATFPTVTAHTGTAMARFNTRTSASGTRQTISTPLFDLSGVGANVAQVSLWIYRYDTLQYDSLNIMINTVRDTNGAVNIGSIAASRQVALPDTQATAGWYQYFFTIPTAFNGDTNYIMIRGVNVTGNNPATGYRIFIDDVSWDTYPGACTGIPSAGTASTTTPLFCGGIGTATLNLSGTSIASGIDYIWVSAADSLGPYTPNGSTGINSTATITSTTWFRCLAICSTTQDTAVSNYFQVVVSSLPQPVVTVTPDFNAYCLNTPDTVPIFVASGASTYSWSNSAQLSITAAGDSATPTVTTGGGYTFVVTGFNSAGCSSIDTATYRIAGTPTVTVTPSTVNLCVGDSATLSATQTGTSFPVTYAWSNGAIGNSIRIPVTGNDTIYAIGTSSWGCSGSQSVDTAIIGTLAASVAATITASDTLICGGSGTVQLSATGSSGVANMWYSSPDGTVGSWTATGTTNNNYSVNLNTTTYFIFVSSCGTDSAASNIILINVSAGPLPVVTVSPDFNAFCLNSGDTIPTFVASGASTYSWSNANNLTITAAGDSATPTVTAGGGYTFIVTGYDAIGCSSSDTATYRIAGTPSVTATPTSVNLCAGDSVTINVTQTGTSFPVTYAWSNGATGTSIRLPITVNETIYITGTSSWGCSGPQSTDTVLIEAIASPVAGSIITDDTVICGGSGSTQLSLSGASGSTFTWYYGSSSSGPWTATNNQGAAINTGILTSATYFICVSSCPSNPSSDDTTATPVYINVANTPLPVVSTNVPQVFYCNNTPPAQVYATGALTYTWSPSTGISGSTTDSIINVVVAQSTYYTVTGYDAAGCSDTGVVWIRYRDNPIVVATPGTGSVCAGDSITLTASITNNIGTGGTMSYTWQPGGFNGNSITVSPGSNESYIVTGISSFGCSDSGSIDTAEVTVDPLAMASLTYNLNANNVTINNTSTDYTAYTIDYGDNSQLTDTLTHTYQSIGQYTITLIASNTCNSDTAIVIVDVLTTAIAELGLIGLNVLPNPVHDRVLVTYSGTVSSIEIVDVLGNKLASRSVSTSDHQPMEFGVTGFASGIYFVRVMNSDGNSAIMRFMKQ